MDVLTYAELDPNPHEVRLVNLYAVQVDVETRLTQERLVKIFDAWKVFRLSLSESALAESGAA